MSEQLTLPGIEEVKPKSAIPAGLRKATTEELSRTGVQRFVQVFNEESYVPSWLFNNLFPQRTTRILRVSATSTTTPAILVNWFSSKLADFGGKTPLDLLLGGEEHVSALRQRATLLGVK